MKKIYLDVAATTSVRHEVVKEMQKYFSEEFGNPSSQHSLGEKAFKALNSAREKMAKEINAKPWEIYFTSGGTESDNFAIKSGEDKMIIVSEIEHPAVMEPAKSMQKGKKLVKIPVTKEGLVDFVFLERKIKENWKNIGIVSVMHVNNIIGTIQNIEKIGELCRRHNVVFHTDAVQSFGKLNIDVKKMNIDMLSASAHKIGGPKGVGLIYVKEKLKTNPLIYGGGQEKGLRSGTENVPGIMGFAKALELERKSDRNKMKNVRSYFIEELGKLGKLNSPLDKGIYNNVHVSFSGVDSGTLVSYLSGKGIYVSTGSACDSKKEKEDHVLRAIGLMKDEIEGSIRISFDDTIGIKDAKAVVEEIKKGLKKFRV